MAGEGFKIAGAYIEVHLQDETEADERRMRARLESSGPVNVATALQDPENTRIVKDRIEASAPAKIRTDADTKLAQAKIAELAASRNAAVVTIDADIAKAESRIENLEAKRGKTKIDVDAEVGKARAKIEALQARKTRILVKAEVDEASIKQASEKVDSETAKMAKRANAQFSALAFGTMFAGLPAAATVAGAGVAAGFAAVPAVFAGIAYSAVRSSDQVSTAWNASISRIVEQSRNWAQPFVGEFVDAAKQVTATADELSPQIAAAFANSAPAVGQLTDGVLSLASEAMPGLVVATRNVTPAFTGLNSLLVSSGRGVTDLFANLSRGAQSSQGILATTGGIIQDLLGFTGSLFANIANNGGPVLAQFRGALQQVENTLLSLTSNGAAIYGFFSGFGSSVSGMLTVVQGLAAGLRLLPEPVTNFAGALTATSMIASKFGLDIGSAFEGLGKKIRDADGLGSKLKTGFAGLVSGAFNPVTLAVGGLALGLSILGQHQQDAAARAAAHADRVRDLASALRESDGAIDGNVRKTAAMALQDFDAGDGKRNLLNDVRNLVGPDGIPTLTEAYLGNTNAQGQLESQLRAVIAANTEYTQDMNGYLVPGLNDTGKAAQQMLDIVSGTSGTFQSAIQSNRDLAVATGGVTAAAADATRAQQLATKGSVDLRTAFQGLASTANDAAAQASALQIVMDRLSGRTPSHEEAIQSMNDTIRSLADDFVKGADKAKGWGAALLNADGTVNTVTENGSTLQNQMTTLQQGFTTAATSINDLVKGGMSFEEASKRVRGELQSQRDRFIDVATQMGLTKQQAQALADTYGLIPDQLTTEVTTPGLTAAQIGMGFLKDKVLDVPNDHTVHARALTEEAIRQLESLGFTVERLPDGTLNVVADTEGAKVTLANLLVEVNASSATTRVFGDAAPALGAVRDWQGVTNSADATTTMYSYTDPATHAVTQWRITTDATGATTTTRSYTDPASGAVTVWKMNTDRTWATVATYANTAAAEQALNYAARDRTSRITVNYVTGSAPTPGGGTTARVGETGRASGAIDTPGGVGFAGGGFPSPTRSNALRSDLAQFVPPGMLRWIGDNARVPELFAPLNGSDRTANLITTAAAHEGLVAPAGRGAAGMSIDYQAMADAVAAAVDAVFAGGVVATWDTDRLEKGLIRLSRRRAGR